MLHCNNCLRPSATIRANPAQASGFRPLSSRKVFMFRTMLKSKIHRVAVTQCELHYEGSCAIDENLLDAANIAENEQIHIWNINNGERFVTYAIKGERGSGMISVNGSAARRASTGDLIIIAAFAQVHDEQVASHQPQLVFVDGHNRQTGLRNAVPTQQAPAAS
jgi:aspartate 1-decarboxylase